MLSIAQEEAERRRRKRKKAGLRSWEIDSACPEAIVSAITQPPTGLAIYSANTHPDEYSTAIRELRNKLLIPNNQSHDTSVNPPAPVAVREPAEEGKHPSRPPNGVDLGPDKPNPPTIVVRLPAAMETCVICLEDIVVGARVRSLPCSHVYHAQCIRVWLRRKNACPCCCVKVIKRRKKRPRPPFDEVTASEPDMGTLRAGEEGTSPVRSATPINPGAARAATNDGVIGREDVTPVVSARPADRCDNTVIDMMEPRSKSMSFCGDRPRWSGAASSTQGAFPRNASLLDPDDPGSEMLASEASSHLDEVSRTALLCHVRRALRGESSLISLNTSVDDVSDIGCSETGLMPGKSDMDEDSFRDSSVLRELDLESARRREMRSDAENEG